MTKKLSIADLLKKRTTVQAEIEAKKPEAVLAEIDQQIAEAKAEEAAAKAKENAAKVEAIKVRETAAIEKAVKLALALDASLEEVDAITQELGSLGQHPSNGIPVALRDGLRVAKQYWKMYSPALIGMHAPLTAAEQNKASAKHGLQRAEDLLKHYEELEHGTKDKDNLIKSQRQVVSEAKQALDRFNAE
jgi:hypothetical protein